MDQSDSCTIEVSDETVSWFVMMKVCHLPVDVKMAQSSPAAEVSFARNSYIDAGCIQQFSCRRLNCRFMFTTNFLVKEFNVQSLLSMAIEKCEWNISTSGCEEPVCPIEVLREELSK